MLQPIETERKMSMWRKLKAFDHYRRAALSMLPISITLLLYLIFTYGDNFLLAEWFLDLIFVPAFIGSLLSGSTYIARALDLVTQSKPSNPSVKEKIGTWLGIGFGIAMGIAATVLHDTIPLVSSLSGLANVIFTLGQIGSFAGLGNRIGSSLDRNRLPNEQKAIGAATFLGITLGMTLLFTSSVALISVAGITSFASCGAAIPFWLGGIIFVTTFSSSLTSFADYSTKAFNFIKTKTTLSAAEPVKQRVKERFHEYRGSLVGVSTGFIVGGIIVGALAVTQPIFMGVLGVIAATLVITTSVNVLGGLCSRIGRLLDGFTAKKVEPRTPEPRRVSTSAHLVKTLVNADPSLEKPLLPEVPPPVSTPRPARPSEAGLYSQTLVKIITAETEKCDKRLVLG